MKIKLIKFPYRYMEYENAILERHLIYRFPQAQLHPITNGYELIFDSPIEEHALKDISYIRQVEIGERNFLTLQGELEFSSPNASDKRQGTRYSTHGLHEYKGKYNPQIVKGALDFMGIQEGSLIFDPFCGSGTTMVECVHHGYRSIGIDINPMAVFISNTKIRSIGLNTDYVKNLVDEIVDAGVEYVIPETTGEEAARINYLKRWIPIETLNTLEGLKALSVNEEPDVANFLKLTISDLIREYSNQEPSDLRIRKRKTPFPTTSFLDAWKNNINKYLESIKGVQAIRKFDINSGCAKLCDVRSSCLGLHESGFDAILTSPPYATALPYIDTQRISLVWLDFCPPEEIMSLESILIGSREFVSNEKKKWLVEMSNGRVPLPEKINDIIDELSAGLQPSDGFRKQAVPVLLYRYFVDMKYMFVNTLTVTRKGGKFGLIVGKNKTTIGGTKYLIDTPQLLSLLAKDCGWNVNELFPLQTYKRYGINSKNAINSETLIVLDK